MPRKRTEPAPASPAKHRGPNWNINYAVVAADSVPAQFLERARPESPYKLALCALLKPENEGRALEFAVNSSVRTMCMKHARDLGVKLLFAEASGKLYVKLAATPKVNVQILEFIKEKPRTKTEIDSMVFNRHLEVDARAEIQTLSAEGLIRLDGTIWKATPKAAANGAAKN